MNNNINTRKQNPSWPNIEYYKEVIQDLQTYPNLVFPNEIINLKNELKEVSIGTKFIIQGGDCAETFKNFSDQVIKNKLKILLQMSAIIQFTKDWEKIYNDVSGDREAMHYGFWAGAMADEKSLCEIIKEMFNFEVEGKISMHNDDYEYCLLLTIDEDPVILLDHEGLLEALMNLSYESWLAENSLVKFFCEHYAEDGIEGNSFQHSPFQYIAKDRGAELFHLIYIHCRNKFTPNEFKRVLEEFEEFYKTNKSVIQSNRYYSSNLLSDAPLEILQNCPPDDELAIADLISILGNIGNKEALKKLE